MSVGRGLPPRLSKPDPVYGKNLTLLLPTNLFSRFWAFFVLLVIPQKPTRIHKRCIVLIIHLIEEMLKFSFI